MSVEIKLKRRKGQKDEEVDSDIECDLDEIDKLYTKKCDTNNKEQLNLLIQSMIELLLITMLQTLVALVIGL